MIEAEKILTARDREVFSLAGYGKRFELGQKPAILVIDMTYEFTGILREPLLDAVKKHRSACGEEAWQAIDCVERLLRPARDKSVPVIYTVMDRSIEGPFAKKNRRSGEQKNADRSLERVVDELKPREGEPVVAKIAPSAFFGTNLAYLLVSQNIDTLFIVGGVTSGCVRASVTDSFSFGFNTVVVKEGVFDRGEASGAMALFDMGAKYANVISETEVMEYLAAI